MITMDMIGKIRRMRLRDGLSFSAIAKSTGLARNTVKKWLASRQVAPPRYARSAGVTKLSAYEAQLTQALTADKHRPAQARRSARALFEQLQAKGYTGSYTLVTNFTRAWRTAAGTGAGKRAFVPLRFGPGEAFQFDWSEEGLVVGGIYYRLQVAHLKLCFSRAFWLVAYPSQSHEMLFDAHTRSFTALGGVARRGIYDNMRTAVDKVLKGKGRMINARFAVMCAHYLFEPEFCNRASGWDNQTKCGCGEG